MTTHRVKDLCYSEEEGNIVMYGSLKECEEFIDTQETDYFTYQIEPLLKEEIEYLNPKN